MAIKYKLSSEEIQEIEQARKKNKNKIAEARLKVLAMRAKGATAKEIAEVPCHHIREYRYVFGAVEPQTGDGTFLVMPYCNTVCMNIFLEHLSKLYPKDIVLLCCDGAAWHKSGGLNLPENIILFHIPPYTPEMNPIEQIWKEIRKRGFRNEVFATLDNVIDRLCYTINSISQNTIKSITGRKLDF